MPSTLNTAFISKSCKKHKAVWENSLNKQLPPARSSAQFTAFIHSPLSSDFREKVTCRLTKLTQTCVLVMLPSPVHFSIISSLTEISSSSPSMHPLTYLYLPLKKEKLQHRFQKCCAHQTALSAVPTKIPATFPPHFLFSLPTPSLLLILTQGHIYIDF